MKIFFDRAFDGGAWPGPLAQSDAVAGEAWLGELGLLGALETALGLGGLVPSAAERAAALVPVIRDRDAFWSDSAEKDPLGVARALLSWRDALVLGGWNGDAAVLPARVCSLAELESSMTVGLPDRIRRVVSALEHRAPDIESITLFETRARLPLLWRRVVQMLENHGTAVAERSVLPSTANGDLGAARDRAAIRPVGDGTLQLLRPDGPWSAAVEAAAWMAERLAESEASSSGAPETLIVSPTPILDGELRRFGCPVTGVSDDRDGALLLEVLALVLSLAWSPADPQDALALLSLPESPVPGGLAGRLRKALGEWPAVGSRAWDTALKDGLAAIPDEARRERVAARLAAIFTGEAARDSAGLSSSALLERVSLVAQWSRGWAGAIAEEERQTPLRVRLEQAAALCAAFSRVVEMAALDAWHPAEIRRFMAEARSGIPAMPAVPAEAGISSVADPAAIVGPARRIVWWDFSRSRAPHPGRLPFSPSECRALADHGIEIPDPGEEALRLAERWRRPLLCAEQTLLLVAPHANEAGDESHPHPLWDEMAARVEDSETMKRAQFVAGSLHVSPRPALSTVDPSEVVVSRRAWSPGEVMPGLPVRASQSEIDALLRCPFRWAVERGGRVRPPEDIDVGVSSRALGKLAHSLLEHVLPEAAGDADRARQLAGAWFDAHAPTHLASLFLPGEETERARDREILVEAAGVFAGFLRDSGLTLVATEKEIEGDGLGRTLFGIPDLVLGPRPVVVDAKWGGRSYREKALKAGTATQLAFYAHLLKQQPDAPKEAAAAAYFVISDRRILSSDTGLGGVAEAVDGADLAETWLGVSRTFDERKAEIAGGQIFATALDDAGHRPKKEKDDAVAASGALDLSAPCRFCKLDGLCGVAFAEASA